MGALIRWLGWWGLGTLVVVAVALILWWRWDQSRQLPLPPQAQVVSSQILGGLAKQTTVMVPQPVADVRAFYHQVLPQRGWAYCGTQTTPHCTNMVNLGAGQSEATDVYRRADDQDHKGTTIEIWPALNATGQTRVVIWETTAFGGG